jgi:hypothetical protein
MNLNYESSRANQYRGDSFALFAPRLADYIKSAYQLDVSFEALPEEAKAIFDGTRIQLSQSISAERQVFIMLHLTGHAFQLANLPEWRDASPEVFDLRLNPLNESMIRGYEIEASRYGAGLLVELGKADLLNWYEALAGYDLEFFITFCKTGVGGVDPEIAKLAPPRLDPLFLERFEPVKVPEVVIV